MLADGIAKPKWLRMLLLWLLSSSWLLLLLLLGGSSVFVWLFVLRTLTRCSSGGMPSNAAGLGGCPQSLKRETSNLVDLAISFFSTSHLAASVEPIQGPRGKECLLEAGDDVPALLRELRLVDLASLARLRQLPVLLPCPQLVMFYLCCPCFLILNSDQNRAASGHAAVCLHIGLTRTALAQQRRDLILGWNRCR